MWRQSIYRRHLRRLFQHKVNDDAGAIAASAFTGRHIPICAFPRIAGKRAIRKIFNYRIRHTVA